MEPINWFMNVVTQHYFDFDGRARRAEFWWYALVYLILAIAADVIDSILGLSVLRSLLGIALLLPSLSLGARRLHDVGQSGWWQLVMLTVIGVLLLIYWWAQPGVSGNNAYGPDPKAAVT